MKESSFSNQVVSNWRQETGFEHEGASGITFSSDARLDPESTRELIGPTPIEMVIGALAGCAGIDVISILKKMRIELISLRINNSYNRAEKHPRFYTGIHTDYYIETNPIVPAKIERAVKMSTETYCSVSAALAFGAEMTYTIHYDGKQISGRHPKPAGS